jgi:hypothetical protein
MRLRGIKMKLNDLQKFKLTGEIEDRLNEWVKVQKTYPFSDEAIEKAAGLVTKVIEHYNATIKEDPKGTVPVGCNSLVHHDGT